MPALSRDDLIALGILTPARHRRRADDATYSAHADVVGVARLPTPAEVMEEFRRAQAAGMPQAMDQAPTESEPIDDDTTGSTR